MKHWKTDLTCQGKLLGKVKTKRGIFQGDLLSPLLFVISLIPLTYILRRSEHGNKFSSNAEKINHLLYMDDLKLHCKSEKELDSLIQIVKIFTTDIQIDFGIDKCAVLIMKRGKVLK